ncbi:transaldolase [Methylacidimicrobium cyclopophantes]|uniref:Transaldolase n=1 Tax=Methylacidimicrobium cyclopophantes TaxID=1041766 RepID=A0A5E6M7I6_9BACT|nr:transaldolase [Methylacidimicrobium cyclopophantes]VVM05181.1 transaldolase [Methylacidimicrobium cyclopophantes]
MKATQKLHELGQSLWVDNISRKMLDDGTLERYIRDYSVTGLTSNPTIFDHAIAKSHRYDEAIQEHASRGLQGEPLFFELAMEDLRRAAELFRPIYETTQGIDGWVSLEVSPLLAYDANRTLEEAKRLHGKMGCPNLLIKIPGTREGLPAIAGAIADGVSINVTLLFSAEHYLAAADAYMTGLERRRAAGLPLDAVASVASLFVSRWDKAILGKVPERLRNQLGIAVAKQTYRAYRELLASDRWRLLEKAGARPQRLLWASTGTKDPSASDILYIRALAAPDTINTMPEETLLAFADHGEIGELLPADGGDAARLLAEFRDVGVDVAALAAQLQRDGADSFVSSWKDLLRSLAERSALLQHA